jgi:transposase
MLALLIHAYAVGERSSRAIERRCREDIAFWAITANHTPDRPPIARFRVRHQDALAGVTGVPRLCAQARQSCAIAGLYLYAPMQRMSGPPTKPVTR